MLLLTTDLHRNYEPLGLVSGHDVGVIFPQTTKVLSNMRNIAINIMIEQAKSMEADAIIGVRFASVYLNNVTNEILVYGTAVKFQ